MAHAKRIFALVFIAVFTIPGFRLVGLAEEPLHFGGVSDIAPMAYMEEGVIKGYFPDIFSEIAHRAGFRAKIDLFSFKRANLYLKEGEIDGMISIFYKKEREDYLVYCKSPLLVSRTLVFVKKNKAFPYKSIKDLYGKIVGMPSGWMVGNSEINQAVKDGKIYADEATRYDQNLKKLMSDRIDCFIGTEHLAWYHAHQLGIAENIMTTGDQISEINTYIAISKKSRKIANPAQFMTQINAAIDSVITDGTQEEFLKKYKITSLK
jgi:polar amino acid transport system substrate-binding protein